MDSALAEFRELHRNRRHKIAENALDRVCRAAPDAEEAEDVVNPKRVEVAAHLREPLFPPRKAVLHHARPVVGRESPVLALGRKRIRRRAGLHIRVEKFRLLPHIRATTTDADGDVALQNQALRVNVAGGFLKLKVQMKLDEIIEPDFVADGGIIFDERGDFSGAINFVRRPLVEIRRAELVAQSAKRRVWHEPVFVLHEEIVIFRAAQKFLPSVSGKFS